jgi:hypothetical protein
VLDCASVTAFTGGLARKASHADVRVIDFPNALNSFRKSARVSSLLRLYELFIKSLHIPYDLSATISHLTDCFHTKDEMGSDDRGDAYTYGDHDARNASAGGL